MLTTPADESDHHCRTVTFASTVEDAEDGEGVTEIREALQQATAINTMLTAML